MKNNNHYLTVGTPVKITIVPSPVKNIAIGTMGTIESKPTKVADIYQVDIKLDDGRIIKWNVDYLEVFAEIEPKIPDSDDTLLKPEVVNLPLDNIRQDGGTQPRAYMDGNTVQDYSLEMSNGVVFPPVIVFYDGTNYWLADGFHRVAAAVFCGWTAIAAIVKQGTCRDAVLFSCGVNATHGLRRTNEDKRRVVLRLRHNGAIAKLPSRLGLVTLLLVSFEVLSVNNAQIQNLTKKDLLSEGIPPILSRQKI